MKFVAAYLLASMAGNPSPTKDDVRKILESVGAEVEEAKLELLFKEVEGKDVDELLAAGREKFAFTPSGAGAGADLAPAAAGASGGGAAAAEKKKEEKAEEKMEEEDDDAMFSLFDD
jgi:large subunit ribosomal protein LP2